MGASPTDPTPRPAIPVLSSLRSFEKQLLERKQDLDGCRAEGQEFQLLSESRIKIEPKSSC